MSYINTHTLFGGKGSKNIAHMQIKRAIFEKNIKLSTSTCVLAIRLS